MKCPYCGEENRDIARFCQHCGQPLEVGPSPEDEAAAGMPGITLNEPEDLEGNGPQVSTEREEPSVVEEAQESAFSEEPAEEIAAEDEIAVVPTGAPGPEMPSAAEPEVPPPPEKAPVEQVPAEVGDKAPEESVPAHPAVALVEEGLAGGDTESTAAITASAPPEEEEEMATTVSAPEVQELEQADLLPWSDKSPSPVTLEPGVVLNGRYQVIEVLSTGEETMYRVLDLQRCPRCGFAGNSPDQAFCASCGAALDQKPEAIMLERAPERAEEAVEAEVEDRFEHDGQMYLVWRETRRRADEQVPPQMRLDVGLKSVTGQVRELDEDSLFTMIMSRTHESVTGQMALFIVADGMGGHEGGEVASKMAIQTMTDVLVRNVFLPELEGHSLPLEEICHWMERAMSQANDQVYLARQKRSNDMGTTMTAALLKDWSLCLAHVGDCRAYRWGVDGLEQLTTDHSIVASMIAAGAAMPEEIYTHPQRSVIYRCIGDRPTVEVDISVLTLSPGDRLILCCDGLWEMIHNEGIEEVMLREADPQKACDIMVEQANLAGGTDNISVIVVQL